MQGGSIYQAVLTTLHAASNRYCLDERIVSLTFEKANGRVSEEHKDVSNFIEWIVGKHSFASGSNNTSISLNPDSGDFNIPRSFLADTFLAYVILSGKQRINGTELIASKEDSAKLIEYQRLDPNLKKLDTRLTNRKHHCMYDDGILYGYRELFKMVSTYQTLAERFNGPIELGLARRRRSIAKNPSAEQSGAMYKNVREYARYIQQILSQKRGMLRMKYGLRPEEVNEMYGRLLIRGDRDTSLSILKDHVREQIRSLIDLLPENDKGYVRLNVTSNRANNGELKISVACTSLNEKTTQGSLGFLRAYREMLMPQI